MAISFLEETNAGGVELNDNLSFGLDISVDIVSQLLERRTGLFQIYFSQKGHLASTAQKVAFL